eukprot:14203426-Alexandrium_andersonii.AAC.1
MSCEFPSPEFVTKSAEAEIERPICNRASLVQKRAAATKSRRERIARSKRNNPLGCNRAARGASRRPSELLPR